MTVQDIKMDKCCGCGYCVKICPQSAIEMRPDENGYLRPVVNNKCIVCGKCVSTCPYNDEHELKNPIATYAACRKQKDKIIKSSSGGVFAAIAECVIEEKGWYVAGCILDKELVAKHILSCELKDIEKMYGSKYVQSDIECMYREVYDKLNEGYKVLFSGTPCQVNAIQSYTKYNENLFTIEVICHGVTNQEMFQSYLKLYNKENISKFVFRDKNQGWSFNNLIVYKNGDRKKINHRLSSYMTYFLSGETYLDACYSCPFATPMRGADLTIGDYWGIIHECQNNGEMNVEKGVSCVLVNTEKGKKIFEMSSIVKYAVPYETIKKGNEPLNHPSNYSKSRSDILSEWGKRHNWEDVDKYFRKYDYSNIYLLWSLLPPKFQHFIRVILGKR